MDQIKARRTAARLVEAGFQVIADSLGGWSGQPTSQVWGVRPAHDATGGIYVEISDLPAEWRRVVS